MLQTTPDQTALPLILTVTEGTTGLSPVVSVRKGTDLLDFDDDIFKASGWATRQAAMTEIGTNAPGTYEYLLNVSTLGLVAGDNLTALYEVPGTVYASEPISIATFTGDTAAIIAAINAHTAAILAAFESANCVIPATTKPTVYTGHKGDPQNLPVFRDGVLMTDAELVGATALVINFFNRDTLTNVPISSGISAGNGFVGYTTTSGDLVYETAGRWEAQAEGISATGEPFRSQVVYTLVRDELQ